MDFEADIMLLSPDRCHECFLRRQQKKTRRIVKICLFIAYNILVLSVVFIILWCLNDRLSRCEENIEALFERHNAKDEIHSVGGDKPLMRPNAVEFEINEENADAIKIESARRKRAAKQKKRRGKKCKNCLPVVQIEGKGGLGYKDKSNLTNLWETPKWVDPKNKQISKYYDISSVQNKGKIKVKEGGLYMIYAQMTLAGVSKRGYHVKKEPMKTTIASCTNHSQAEGYDDADHIFRPCTLFTVFRLEKNDIVYIEEMGGNTNMYYTKLSAVFGLIRVGV